MPHTPTTISLLWGPGKDDDELSCHFFAGGKLSGHAFLSGQAVYSLDTIPKDLKPLKETDLLKHYLLREFHDWKTRASRDHSIKVLKSHKKAKSSNGNQLDIDGNQQEGPKKKKPRYAHKKKNSGHKKKKYSKKPYRKYSDKKAKPAPSA